MTAADHVCTLIPDADKGFGVGRATPSEIQAGGDQVIVADPVPDGGVAPTVIYANGERVSVPVEGNVATTVLSATDTVDTGAAVLDLKELAGP